MVPLSPFKKIISSKIQGQRASDRVWRTLVEGLQTQALQGPGRDSPTGVHRPPLEPDTWFESWLCKSLAT